MTIGTSELAARLGISRQRVNELGRLGKITREPDGKWDPAKVAAALGKNLDGRQQSPARERVVEMKARDRAVAAPHKVGAGGGRKAKDGSATEEHPPEGTLLYEQWRLTREKADREALDRQALEGALLKRDEVRAAVSSMISAAKSKFLTVGDELCDRLAATSDPIACREMVDARIHQALSELAEYPSCA
jgi:hypothetical protein